MRYFIRTIGFLVGLVIVFTCFSFTNIQKVSEKKWQGIASYYHSKFEGRRTATGELFSNRKLTAANNFLKLGTRVRVTNLINGKSVIVKINDRMNKKNQRLIDLSHEAAKQLGFVQQGLGHVVVEILSVSSDYLAAR
jgi:rare lipoprotein A